MVMILFFEGSLSYTAVGTQAYFTLATKYVYLQSTTVYVPSSEMGLSHPPPLTSECAPPPGTKGGGHTRLRVRGWGSPNSDDWRKSLALCLLCDSGCSSKHPVSPDGIEEGRDQSIQASRHPLNIYTRM
jgi:hypothetical protein